MAFRIHSNERSIKINRGRTVHYHPASRASRDSGTRQYRNDTVEIDGVQLLGHICVKEVRGHKLPNGRYTSHVKKLTVYQGVCVDGVALDWLAARNGINLTPAAAPAMAG